MMETCEQNILIIDNSSSNQSELHILFKVNSLDKCSVMDVESRWQYVQDNRQGIDEQPGPEL